MDAVSYLGVKDDNGKFSPDSPKAFSLAMARFQPKEKIKVTFEKHHETRSKAQNRAFFGIVVRAFCDEFGYRFNNKRDRDFVYSQVLLLCGWYEVKRGLHGEEVKEPKPTHNLPKHQFKQLYETAQEEGAKLGLMIADPESSIALAARI